MMELRWPRSGVRTRLHASSTRGLMPTSSSSSSGGGSGSSAGSYFKPRRLRLRLPRRRSYSLSSFGLSSCVPGALERFTLSPKEGVCRHQLGAGEEPSFALLAANQRSHNSRERRREF